MNNKSKNTPNFNLLTSENRLKDLHKIEDQLRVLALSEDNTDYKRKLLSLRNQMSNLIDEMEYEESKKEKLP